MPRNLTRRLFLSLALATLAPSVDAEAQAGTGTPLRVMTFNIRYNNPGDSLDAWPHRSEGVASLIRFHDPDVVGLQEAQRNQLDDLQRLLPGYAWFGVPRSDGGPRDEHTAILYRTDRLEPLARGTFWLSETPDVPASKGWDAALPRNATWGRFRDRATGDTLVHLNTHFDHMGVRAREESSRLMSRWLAQNARGQRVIVTGDFNTTPDAPPFRTLVDPSAPFRLTDAMGVSAEPHHGPTTTWNGFRAIEPGRRIDFIFVGNGVRVLEHGVLSETLEGGRFPSDHLPVLAEVLTDGAAR